MDSTILTPQQQAILRSCSRDEQSFQTLQQLFDRLARPAGADESLFRAAIDASLDAFYLLQAVRGPDGAIEDFVIVETNKLADLQMGMTRDELIGGKICELFPINRTNGFFEQYKRVAETGEPLVQEFYIPRFPGAGWHAHQIVRVNDGVAISNRDISSIKVTEESLRDSQRRYQLLLDNVPAMLYSLYRGVNGEFFFTYISPGCRELTGLEPDEILADPNVLLDLIHPSDREDYDLKTVRSSETTGPFYWEGRMIVKGETRWIRLESRRRTLPDGARLWDGIHVDITAQKQHEHLLRSQAVVLEERVRERTAELEAAHRDLVRLAQVKDDFLDTVSHELGTPLSTIKLYLHLIGLRPDQFARYRDILEREVARLEGIFGQMLMVAGLSKHAGWPSPPTIEPFDLAELLRSRVLAHESDIHTRGLILRHVQADQPITVYGDHSQIARVIDILLTNALNYTEPGGEVGFDAVTEGAAGEQWAVLRVSNSGEPIAEDEVPFLFDRFVRGKISLVMRQPGAGLGLAIAKAIVESHKGDICLEANGEASLITFRVRLPVTRA